MSETTEKRRLGVDWVTVVAGALAAVSSAVLLSTLGAAGTLIGAALGSVIVSITSSLYGKGLARGTEKVAVVQTVALAKVTSATPEDSAARREQPDETTDETTGDRPGWRDRLTAIGWKRIALAAGGIFLVAVVILTAVEVIGGRSISSYTGGSSGAGTSIGGVLGERGARTGDDDDQTPQDDATRTPNPGSPATQTPGSPSSDPVETTDPTVGGGSPTPDDSATPSDDDDEETEDPEDPSPTTPTAPSSPTTTR